MEQKTAVEAYIKWRYEADMEEVIEWMDKYTNFLTQDITLADFVPCMELTAYDDKTSEVKYKKHIPLEKPDGFNSWLTPSDRYHSPESIKKYLEYQQALDRVVYSDWILMRSELPDVVVFNPDFGSVQFFEDDSVIRNHTESIKTRQDMVGFEMKELWYKKYFNN